MKINLEQAYKIQPQLVEWRRALHQTPEVGLNLPQTAKTVEQVLKQMGVPYRQYPSASSIVAVIEGALPGGVVGLRADMDALPIREESGEEFAASNGNMHACGHDAHTAMLLGAMQMLLDCRDTLAGKVVCIFQAGEEGEDGAAILVRDGGMDEPRPQAVFAQHVTPSLPELPSGCIGFKEGPILAGSYRFLVRLEGQGGHVSNLSEQGNAVWAAAELTSGIRLLNRQCNHADKPGLIAVSMLRCGQCSNAVPDDAELEGEIRSKDPQMLAALAGQLGELAEKYASEFECHAKLQWIYRNDCLVNDALLTRFARESVMRRFPGECREIETEILASEDVSNLFACAAGTYIHIGSGSDGVYNYPLHNSHFRLNEDILWRGAAVMAGCAADWLDMHAEAKGEKVEKAACTR